MLQKGGARNRKDNTYSFSPFWVVLMVMFAVSEFSSFPQPRWCHPKEKMDAAEIDVTYSNSQRSQ